MSEERLERIEGKVDILVSGQIDLAMRMGRVEGRLDQVDGRLDNVEGKQGELQAAVQQIAEGHGALTRQIARGFESIHTVLDQRLRPLEDTVKEHSAILRTRGLMP